MNNTSNQGEYGTMPEWDMKSILLNQYSIAYNNLADYIVEPTKTSLERDARKSILKLAYPLFPKLYVLGKNWNKERDYIAYFMAHPDEMYLMECQATFLILQVIMERLGITKFERWQLHLGRSHEEE